MPDMRLQPSFRMALWIEFPIQVADWLMVKARKDDALGLGESVGELPEASVLCPMNLFHTKCFNLTAQERLVVTINVPATTASA